MRVTWSRRARRDLRQIRSYIGWDNPGAADMVADHIKAAVRRIGDHPHLGVRRSDRFREFVEPRYRYVVRYGLLPDTQQPHTVVILSIWHSKQAR